MKRVLSRAEPAGFKLPESAAGNGLHNNVQAEKAELRKTIKTRLASLSPGQFSSSGFLAAKQLLQIPRWHEFCSVFAFRSMKDEIDTVPLIETIISSGKSLFFASVMPNPSLILKPEDFPVLVITPGIAFDRSLNRLGRGQGYYDRFFADLDEAKQEYFAVGLCMECQLVDEVPIDSWDKKMDMVLTEKGFVG